MSRRAAVAVIAVVVLAVTVAGVWFAFARDEKPWPPDWYAEAAHQDDHLALRRPLRKRAVNPLNTEFPPRKAKLDLLRLMAVGAATEPDDTRPTDVRVFFSDRVSANSVISGGPSLAGGASVYVLAIRGKFSTAGIRRPPGAPRPRYELPAFSPMVILVIDAATMDVTDTYQGRVRDLSPLGSSVALDLSQEPG
jgi:hypothetical protein